MGLIEWAKETASDAVDYAGDAASGAVDYVEETASDVAEGVGGAVDYVEEAATGAYQDASETVGGAVDYVEEAATETVNDGLAVAGNVYQGASDAVGGAIDYASDVYQGASATVNDGLEWAGDKAKAAGEFVDHWGGAMAGGTAGAIMGAPLGPLGMLLGGAAGALIGDEIGNPGRPLSEDERKHLEQIYGKDGFDYDSVRIRKESLLSLGASRTIGNSINLEDGYTTKDGKRVEYFNPDGSLTEAGLETLSHESMHSWQYQKGGVGYMADSLSHQCTAACRHDDRGAAYAYAEADKKGLPWEKWSAEQQASAIEDWHTKQRQADALQTKINEETDPAKKSELQKEQEKMQKAADKLVKYRDKVRAGTGAAKFDGDDIDDIKEGRATPANP